jgi:hypothetical protein
MAFDITEQYVCPRCFSVDAAPGACPRCGLMRRHCELGGPDDDTRRPPMDAAGHILSRAPLWWVQTGAPYLREQPAGGQTAGDRAARR